MGPEGAREDDTSDEASAAEHLDGIADGCGCAEIWEHLSERHATDD